MVIFARHEALVERALVELGVVVDALVRHCFPISDFVGRNANDGAICLEERMDGATLLRPECMRG